MPSFCSFNSSSWDVPQTFIIRFVDDFIDMGNSLFFRIPFGIYTNDTVYANYEVTSLVVNVHDNDNAGISISPTSVIASEGFSSYGFDACGVCGGDSSLCLGDICTTGQGCFGCDGVLESNVYFDRCGICNGDSSLCVGCDLQPYSGMTFDSCGVCGGDNLECNFTQCGDSDGMESNLDACGVCGGNNSTCLVELTECDGSTYFEVFLYSEPMEVVAINIISNSRLQFTLAPDTITFQPSMWNIPQPIHIIAVDDSEIESVQVYNLSISVDTVDVGYRVVGESFVEVSIFSEDRNIGLNISNSSIHLTESGREQAIWVSLESRPRGNAMINLNSIDADDRIYWTPEGLNFNTTSWMLPQPFIIYPIDNHKKQINLTSILIFFNSSSTEDAEYNRISTTAEVFIEDDDIIGLSVSHTSLAITESGAHDTMFLSLLSEPLMDVAIKFNVSLLDIHSSCIGQVEAEKYLNIIPQQNLSIDPLNWNLPHPVSVSATNDLLVSGPSSISLSFTTGSKDFQYNKINVSSVTSIIHITDDDSPGLNVSHVLVFASEGVANGSYNVSLLARPCATVQVLISVVSDSISLSTQSLAFLPNEWSLPQEILIVAVEDSVDRGVSHLENITHTIIDWDISDTQLNYIVTVNVTDNDISTILLQPDEVVLNENMSWFEGTNVSIKLSSEPSNLVNVSCQSGYGMITISPLFLEFDSFDWFLPQMVSIHSLDDFVDRGSNYSDQLSLSVSSKDTNYHGIHSKIVVEIYDDDIAGLQVISNSVFVSEDGQDDVISMKLSSQPLEKVTVQATPISKSELFVVPFLQTISPEQWNASTYFYVTAIKDTTYHPEREEIVQISCISSDSLYNGIVVNVTVRVVEFISAGGAIGDAQFLSFYEGQNGLSTSMYTKFCFELLEQTNTSVNVSIMLSSFGTLQPTGSLPQLEIVPWQVQILPFESSSTCVNISVVDDNYDEDDMYFHIELHMTSDDQRYQIDSDRVALVHIEDDDDASIFLSPQIINCNESSHQNISLYGISLNAEPVGDSIKVTSRIVNDLKQINVSSHYFEFNH